MTDQPDPEAERLADLLEGEEAFYCGPGYGTCGGVGVGRHQSRDLARAVLADLQARYVLIPREGVDPTPPTPGVQMTTGQVLHRLLTETPEARTRYLDGLLRDARKGSDCLLFDHAGQRHDADLTRRRLLEVMEELRVLKAATAASAPGTASHREHEVRDDGGVLWHSVAMDANLDPRVTFHHRYRTVTVGPWEPAP